MTGRISILLVFLSLDRGGFQAHEPIYRAAPGSPFRAGTTPLGLTAADVNGDGRLDLLTANRDSRDVTILLGDGRGGFRPAATSPVAVNFSASFIAAGDLNGDRRIDLALAQHEGSYDVVVLLGDGTGGFAAARGSPFRPIQSTEPHNHGLLLADVSSDGNLDIVTANGGADAGKGDNSVSILLNDGRAVFSKSPRSPVPIGGLPAVIVGGDLNADGRIDLVAAHEGKRTLSIVLGDGQGGFTPAPGSPFPLPAYANSLALGDINNDRKIDIVTTRDQSALLTVLIGQGEGRVEPAPGPPVDIGTHGWNASLGDVNGDSKLDLVARGQNNSLVLLLGSGDARFKRAEGLPITVGKDPFSLLLVDLNGDRKPDIVTANSAGNDLTVLLAR